MVEHVIGNDGVVSPILTNGTIFFRNTFYFVIMLYPLLVFSLFFPALGADTKACDYISYNKCYSCDNPIGFSVGNDESCKFLCPNRVVNYEGSGSSVISRACVLEKCPKKYPFQSRFGDCFATQKEADYYDTWDFENFNNDDKIDSYQNAVLAVNGVCPENAPLLEGDRCYSCDTRDILSLSEDICRKCPNRVYKSYPRWKYGECELPCPPDKPLQRWDGKCFSCNEPKAVLLPTHCNLEKDCEDICPNRTVLYTVGGSNPSVPNCPKDRPLMDSEGVCFSCDTPVPVDLGWGNEALCEKFCKGIRELHYDQCILKK